MKTNLKAGFGMICAVLGFSAQAYAWNGPICYPDENQTITLMHEKLPGTSADDLIVELEDNENELELVSVRQSPRYPRFYEIVLRHQAGDEGITVVKLRTPYYDAKAVYEFEFRKDKSSCNAIIEVTRD